MFRQTQQLPGGGETLDQFHARLLQLSKNCNFVNRDGEIRSQIIQKCAMAKIRDKGLSEADITLEQLLRYGRTLESTIQQSLMMSNSAHATSTTAQSVNACAGAGLTFRIAPVNIHSKLHFRLNSITFFD